MRLGEVSCARNPAPVQPVDPSASFDLNDPRQRALRALAEQYGPTPKRGAVPEAAVPGAEACVHALEIYFSLLAAGSRSTPQPSQVDQALRSAGLTNIVVAPGPVFGASTGELCVFGAFTTNGPEFTLGPPATDGSCRP